MPYEWTDRPSQPPAEDEPGHADGAPPIAVLHLWPYRSLPRRGFAMVIWLAFGFLLIPLAGLLGTPILWVILAFGMAAIAGLWWSLQRSYADAEILEELSLWPDHMRLVRRGPRGAHQEWQANPYWVSLQKYDTGAPVPHYVTLRGGGREVEIGAFLSEEERPRLYEDLQEMLVLLRSRRPAGGGDRA